MKHASNIAVGQLWIGFGDMFIIVSAPRHTIWVNIYEIFWATGPEAGHLGIISPDRLLEHYRLIQDPEMQKLCDDGNMRS